MKTPTEIHAEVGEIIGLENDKYGRRVFTVSDIEKIITEAKAEAKGVCEWGKHALFNDYKTTSCKRDFYHSQAFRFCPGCGKEIKIV